MRLILTLALVLPLMGQSDGKILHWTDNGINDSKILLYRDNGINAPPQKQPHRSVNGCNWCTDLGNGVSSCTLLACIDSTTLEKFGLHPPADSFNFSAPTWADRTTGKATLAYCIVQPAPADAERQIKAALAEWAKYIQVTFVPGACYADRTLTFSWVADAHGDMTNFRGRDMAHAFWPPTLSDEPQAGDIHFRASEDWTPPLEIYSVALHEIGHALGVWDVKRGVMDEVSWWRHLTLQTSDIEAVRRHYAKRCWEIECAMRWTQ